MNKSKLSRKEYIKRVTEKFKKNLKKIVDNEN